jgi:hypothetical protein
MWNKAASIKTNHFSRCNVPLGEKTEAYSMLVRFDLSKDDRELFLTR